MGLNFTFDELIELALKMEEEGISFYRSLAEREEEPRKKELFMGLAEMEKEHFSTFQKMRQELGSRSLDELTDPQGEAVLYLGAMVKGKIFKPEQRPEIDKFTSMEEILNFAIEREKDSVVYYLGFMEAMKDEGEQEKLRKIIRQELGHIAELNQILEGLSR